MGQTSILYTAIPDPTYPGPGLCITVAISPRLVGGAPETQLAEFPEMLDWPQRLAGMLFEVDIGWMTWSAQLRPARRLTEQLDLTLYQNIFPSDCLVRPWQFVDGQSRTLHEFPATDIHQRITDLYREVAASGTALPRVLDVGDLAHCAGDPADPHGGAVGGPPCDVIDYVPNAVDRMLLDYEAAAAALDSPWLASGLTPPQRALHRGLGFYRREQVPGPPDVMRRFDAHERAALLVDHPTLLRRCGLAFDLILPIELMAIPPSGEIRIRPRWRGWDNPLDLCPRTLYDTAGGRFRAASWGGMVSNGYLALEQPQFSVVQLDCDSGLIGVASSMASSRSMITDPHSQAHHEQALPALHSAGVSLMQRDRDVWLAQRFQKQFSFHIDPQWAVFDADDLVCGWRIDVEAGAAGNGWRSLHRRHGEVKTAGAFPQTLVSIPETVDEEGFVKAASGTSQRSRPQDLYLHEKVVGWSGWSLSARRPSKTVKFVPAVTDASGERTPAYEEVVDDSHDPGTMPVVAHYKATPGTLTRLRFGELYRLRARAVDLAGGSLPEGDLDGSHATQPFRYQRFSPVAAPQLVQRMRIAPAESVEHMAVCTDENGVHAHTVTRNERHILAPKCSLEMWEQHGMFETVPATAAERYHIAARERGTLIEPFVHNRDGLDEPLTDRRLCNPPTAVDPYAPFPDRGEPLSPGQYLVCPEDRMRLTYLPDVCAYGVAVWDKNNPGFVVRRRFQPRPGAPAADAAFDLDSLLLVLLAAPAGSAAVIHAGNETDREIYVELPPGGRLELCYASIPHPDRLESLAVWNLLTAADQAALGPAIRNGQHWMFTPHRTVLMCHAAQHPVEAPAFAAPLAFDRQEGAGRVKITGSIRAHSHTTSHVDVRGRWAEVADDAETGATETTAECDVFRVPFAYGNTVAQVAQSVEIIERRPRTTNLGPLLAIVRRTEGTDTHHDLPDGKRRIVTYTPVATTRWQEYLPLDVIADRTDNQPSNLVTAGVPHEPVSIPASIRPAPPQVAQMLPAFRRTGMARSRNRRGNAVRIYLERPWFSTGVGERLAILVERAPVLPPRPTPADWVDKVSRWAADAVWSRPAPNPQPLSPDAFVIDPNDGVPAFGGLRPRARVEVVRDIGGAPVDAIVVVPQFSRERQQWYCDLELTGSTYFPYLSLALARYQEHAVGSLGLSEVVRAELVQLAPDRSASITLNATGRKATVRVRGVSAGNRHEPQHTAAPGGAHRVRAHVEVPGNAIADLDWIARVPIDLAPAWANADEVEWTGILGVPAGNAWRIVIEESEVYAGDDRGAGTTSAERITYVEVLTPT